ncbi:single-stranded DNA-binding protein [Bifidobacterium avesanii]|uniref:Single-stranded DNA-binding protein n=1 Tax=Bifidobacterium avesanii TaxID=1798157 RepID=A0A7K3TH34_9BIFI|nr:single-stranded DNA-binding protein [Bifidobacterium avesanii]KAB8290626.1 single-strand binding protein [Bifidobacterium avesanii]NEG77994.1 single-stranded DNA-binding protein [Bifidobacterium avesanii]
MAAQQGIITVNGYVGGQPKRLGQTGGTPISVFNMGTTRSFYDQKTGNWVDLPTTWLKVKAFRALALNVMTSIHKGDPVIVTGQLGTEEWKDRDGKQQSSVVINATNIGHDLNTGSTKFTRVVHQRDPLVNNQSEAPQPGPFGPPAATGDAPMRQDGQSSQYAQSQRLMDTQSFGGQGGDGSDGRDPWAPPEGTAQSVQAASSAQTAGGAPQPPAALQNAGGSAGPATGDEGEPTF